MIIYTKQRLYELIEDPSTIEISTFPDKHDYTVHTCVTEIDRKQYMFKYISSYNEGIQFWGEIDLVEVKPVEYTAIKWEKV